MTKERWQSLMNDMVGEITKEEFAEGWHWCSEFDDLLVGPGMGELSSCFCFPRTHPVYKTITPALDPNDGHVF